MQTKNVYKQHNTVILDHDTLPVHITTTVINKTFGTLFYAQQDIRKSLKSSLPPLRESISRH